MIKQLSTKTIYQNKWMKLREDQVEFDNQKIGIYSVVEKPDFALIVPFENGKFTLIQQYRYPVNETVWEFPQGGWEEKPDTDPTVLAKAELLEETGYSATSIEEIGYLFEAYGYANQGMHVFLATDLQKGEQRLEDSESGLVIGQFTIKEFETMVIEGEIKDAPTVSAYGLLKIKKIV